MGTAPDRHLGSAPVRGGAQSNARPRLKTPGTRALQCVANATTPHGVSVRSLQREQRPPVGTQSPPVGTQSPQGIQSPMGHKQRPPEGTSPYGGINAPRGHTHSRHSWHPTHWERTTRWDKRGCPASALRSAAAAAVPVAHRRATHARRALAALLQPLPASARLRVLVPCTSAPCRLGAAGGRQAALRAACRAVLCAVCCRGCGVLLRRR
jgi:hypothetical protein